MLTAERESLVDKLKVLHTAEEVALRLDELAGEIDRDYAGLNPVLVSVLRGSIYFAVDLTRRLKIPFTLDFISASRYGSEPGNPGLVRITRDPETNLAGRHVLLLEDIVDSGLSLSYILRNLKTHSPASLKVCTLVNIEARRIVSLTVQYTGFHLPNVFVVGCGLDYHEDYRTLPYLAEYQQ